MRSEEGTELWAADPPQRRRVIDTGVAYLVTDVLREARAPRHRRRGARRRLPRRRRRQDGHHQRRHGHLVRRLHAEDRGGRVDRLRRAAADHGAGHGQPARRAGLGPHDGAGPPGRSALGDAGRSRRAVDRPRERLTPARGLPAARRVGAARAVPARVAPQTDLPREGRASAGRDVRRAERRGGPARL